MAAEGKRSKGRFLYLFDWNAKSRKNLFSNKSEFSDGEGCSQGKESVDNLAISQYLLRELSENGDRRSFRRNGDYSCASSVNGDDGYGTKAPGVVARLMGLDSIPTTTPCDSSSFASYEPRAIGASYYRGGASPFEFEQHIMGYSFVPNKGDGFPWNSVDSRMSKVNGRPIERFQTEVLPPKSAKPISITHHKLLSPIKSPGFVPTKDATYIMEAAARIIDSAPQPSGRVKVSSLESPSSSFRFQDLKDKLDAAQRSSRQPKSPKTPKMSAPAQQVRGITSERVSRKSLFKNITSSQASSSLKVKNKGKSIPLAVQDKANLQEKVGSARRDSRSQQQDSKKLKQRDPNTQKFGHTRTPRKKSSGVLRQNSEKQNSVSQRDQSTTRTSLSDQQNKKISPRDNCAGPSKIVSKIFVNAENSSKKVATTRVMDRSPTLNDVSEKRPLLNRMKNISRNKRVSAKDNHFGEKVLENDDERAVQRDLSFQGKSRKDMDVISFTFTSPIKKAGSQSSSATETIRSNHLHLCADSYGIGQFDESSLSSSRGLNSIDSGSLGLLLEQKLRELTDKIGSAKSDLVVASPCTNGLSCLSESISLLDVATPSLMDYDDWSDKDQANATCDDDCSSSIITKSSRNWEDFEGIDEQSVSSTSRFEACGESHLDLLTMSIPECSMSGSWMSSTTASDITHGNGQPSSPHSQAVISCESIESAYPREDESDFNDASSYWELEYVRHMLHYSALKRLKLDEDCEIIDPDLFDLLENLINSSGKTAEPCSKLERKILFNCVTDSVNTKYQRAFFGSYKSWAKWGMLLQNELLTEELFKEILCWQNMGNLMVDELVDWDMSTPYGRWLDFEIESVEEGIDIEKEIVASLIDELVADLTVYSHPRQ